MSKKSNETKIKRTEVIYYRMLIALAALIAVIFSITYFTQTPEAANSFRIKTAPIIGIAFGVLSLPAIVYFVLSRINGRDEKCKVFASGFVLLLSLWLTSIFGFYGSMSSKKLIAYIIVTAVLYFVYYLFSREFFLFSLYCALGAGFLILINSAVRHMHIIYAVVVVLISAVAIILALADKKNPVSLKLGKAQVKVTNGSLKAYPFCIAAGIMLAGVILSFFAASMAFYSLIVLFAFYLLFMVVNTVKMM